MTLNARDYDLFSLIKSVLSEDTEVSWDKEEEKIRGFLKGAEQGGYAAPKGGSKKKKSVNQSKDEDYDIIDDEDADDEESEEVEEKEEPTSVNLSDAASYEKLVDDLNMFRAAHSFSDTKISKELKSYFESLTKEEKQVLHVLIKGLIHVTMMDVKGKSAKTPSDFSLNVKKSGATSKEKKKSLNKRIAAEKQGKKVDSNTPIKIGESKQNKSEVLKVILSNN